MPKIESDLGSQNIPSRPMRNLTIPDESGYTQQQQPQPQQPTMIGAPSGNFAPSISRRQGRPMNENEMRDWQSNIQATLDPDSQLSDLEREFKQAREDKKRGQTMLNEGARRRVEMLIGMTRQTRTADIEGNTYVLQTLKGKEMREAIMASSEFDNTVQSPFEIRRQFLARSLIVVANVPMDQFAGSNDLEAKLSVIDEMDDILLNRIMDEYNILIKESRSKYAIKTPEEAQEVSEDLKK